ncbi:peptidyl-dipeptidase Dcp [Microbacterium halimionae]|uniref:Peptidyl-dipeptidase Dcp n=1 Tax=Microbacterium halimionae TaxID=1526413 RepID=A0A7W3PLL0_9MICO|nr:M3 family metallopeptidase [Microbacterium halimionae]MBA8815969.1 peptidyl-dipeptidase Dcp [Microbacterium halimionae]NII96172.1 peptidyl-dipeptidase Dcp [Microbacterium halimionae]
MTDASANPLLTLSDRPYGLPPYDLIESSHYLPAFEAGFAEHRAQIAAITASEEPATFENTLVAWERSGELLGRVSRTFYTVSSADATAAIQEIDELLAPLMSAHFDGILLDSALYKRVSAVHAERGALTDPEPRYLVERRFTAMTRAGAGLNDEAKRDLRELNQRLSVLTTSFEKNLLADTNDLALHFTDDSELSGLGSGELQSAKAAAGERGLEGYLITLRLFTGHPLLASLTSRETRAKLMHASRARGTAGGAHPNDHVLLEIVRLRAERAELLGFESHAAFITSGETAGSPDAVAAMLRRLAVPAARNAAAEQSALQRIIDEGVDESYPLKAYDWAYATEKVRAAEYDLDTAALRPWFEANRVLKDGVFFAASALYGVTFTEREDVGAYHPDARVFEVHESDGSPIGLFILDLYTRDSKRGGAWMNSITVQSALGDEHPIVVNNLNVSKPAEGEPTLLTLDEVTTLFHEFGHALHGLFARVTFPSFGGTNVFRDFVEFPSQVNEMWIYWPEVLQNYARHVETGAPLPQEIVESLTASAVFNEGFATSEYLAAAWLDQAWHSLSAADAATVSDVAAFERDALDDIGLQNPVIPPRYSSTYFAHVFSGGYSAGYYSYIWSEVLDADTVKWFGENGGLALENGERFRSLVLGVGGSQNPLDAFRNFRGRDADIAPLLERRGLTS